MKARCRHCGEKIKLTPSGRSVRIWYHKRSKAIFCKAPTKAEPV